MAIELKKLKQVYTYMLQPQEKLLHPKFDFRYINVDEDDGIAFIVSADLGAEEKNLCGTNGCMAGEFPGIFPDDFYFNHNGELKTSFGEEGLGAVRKYLGLTAIQMAHLFKPGHQNTFSFGGKFLSYSASKSEVVENLRIFIHKIEKGEIT